MDRDEIFYEKYLGNAYESCICTGLNAIEEIAGIITEDGDFITTEDDQILILE